MTASTIDPRKMLWYRRYRGVAYLNALAALIWTVVIVIPYAPFTQIPAIMVAGGPGVWLVLAYLLFIMVGIGGFGALSAFLTTVELHERRIVDSRTMWPALILLSVGVAASCLLLAVAGAVGGYVATSGTSSGTSIDNLLSPYVYPTTAFVLVTVVGACLAVVSMARARWPTP